MLFPTTFFYRIWKDNYVKWTICPWIEGGRTGFGGVIKWSFSRKIGVWGETINKVVQNGLKIFLSLRRGYRKLIETQLLNSWRKPPFRGGRVTDVTFSIELFSSHPVLQGLSEGALLWELVLCIFFNIRLSKLHMLIIV